MPCTLVLVLSSMHVCIHTFHILVCSSAAGFSQKLPISDTVDLDDMTFNPESETYSLPCRCGGCYDITEDDMERGVEIVCCSTCTLCVRVLYQLAHENGENLSES